MDEYGIASITPKSFDATGGRCFRPATIILPFPLISLEENNEADHAFLLLPYSMVTFPLDAPIQRCKYPTGKDTPSNHGSSSLLFRAQHWSR
jgi:hypothetical protein